MSLPLAGCTVVEFGHYIAAPAATQVLAHLGAEVIKVESGQGDQARVIGAYGEGIVCAYNRGKRSVRMDLKDPEELARARDLVAAADVVVQNLRSGSMDRLGLGEAALRRRRPELVYVTVSGFGARGPSSARAGLDIAAQAESGMMSITGAPDGDPQRIGFPVADVGASYAVAQAVLAALLRRERTGEGAHAEVSLLDTAVHMQAAMWGEWARTGRPPRRKGNGQATACPAADLISTRDGTIVLSAYTTEHFARLCHLIEKPWLVDDPRFVDNPSRVRHRAVLLAEIQAVLGALGTEECVQLLSAQGLVAAHVREYAEVAASPDVLASGNLTTGIDPEGRRFTVPAMPFRLDGVEVEADLRVPQVGEDNDQVLGAPGLTGVRRDP